MIIIKVRESQKRGIVMKISDLITEEILRAISESDEHIADIQRNMLASHIGCAPSQINYVLSSRFTPENGYIIESQRGGGGYIRIKKVIMNKTSPIMHIINSLGDTIDQISARIVIENCLESGLISQNSARVMYAALSNNVMRQVPVEIRDKVRAATLKEMLLVQI